MPIIFDEITEYKIYSVWPEKRYKVLLKLEFDSPVELARSGAILLFLTDSLLIYSEIDDDLIYGGGSPKREKVQKISNYLEAGPVHPFPSKIKEAVDSFISGL